DYSELKFFDDESEYEEAVSTNTRKKKNLLPNSKEYDPPSDDEFISDDEIEHTYCKISSKPLRQNSAQTLVVDLTESDVPPFFPIEDTATPNTNTSQSLIGDSPKKNVNLETSLELSIPTSPVELTASKPAKPPKKKTRKQIVSDSEDEDDYAALSPEIYNNNSDDEASDFENEKKSKKKKAVTKPKAKPKTTPKTKATKTKPAAATKKSTTERDSKFSQELDVIQDHTPPEVAVIRQMRNEPVVGAFEDSQDSCKREFDARPNKSKSSSSFAAKSNSETSIAPSEASASTNTKTGSVQSQSQSSVRSNALPKSPTTPPVAPKESVSIIDKTPRSTSKELIVSAAELAYNRKPVRVGLSKRSKTKSLHSYLLPKE
ncbi:hypothetical protein HK098_007907, partial [Nowakowskiella sp. JEL0407]